MDAITIPFVLSCHLEELSCSYLSYHLLFLIAQASLPEHPPVSFVTRHMNVGSIKEAAGGVHAFT